jgi:adenosylcobinamide-GDP ribazoletransferase
LLTGKKTAFNDFRSAIQFITIIPAGKHLAFNPLGMIRFFPLTGLLIGLGLAVVDLAASWLWSDGVAAVLDVLYLVIVTGAFHLDGVGDTADGIFSHRSKERALEIMKDSRSGMMGLIAVFCVLAIKLAGMYAVKTSTAPVETIIFLVVIPGLSRCAMLFGIRMLPYGRTGTGTGHALFSEKLSWKAFIWMLVPVTILLLSGAKGWLLIIVFLITTQALILFYRHKMGCITGDMLGAMTEVCEAILFLCAGIQLI